MCNQSLLQLPFNRSKSYGLNVGREMYKLPAADPISGDMIAYGLRARVQMLEALICRIARELPPGACSEATRSSIDGVVAGRDGSKHPRST